MGFQFQDFFWERVTNVLRRVELETNHAWEVVEQILDDTLRRLGCSSPTSHQLWDKGLRVPLQSFLSRPGKEFRGGLTRWAWCLNHDAPPAPELVVLVELIHAGSLIIDDIQDGSETRRGQPALHRQFGVPIALNTGSILYFLPFSLLSRLGLPTHAENTLRDIMTDVMLHCHQGQAMDLAGRIDRLPPESLGEVVRVVTQLKTAGLMEFAVVVGCLASDTPASRTRELAELGHQIGIGLQMLNDWADLGSDNHQAPAYEDLRRGRPTWAWAWLANTVPRQEYLKWAKQARAVRREKSDPSRLACELRDLLSTTAHAEIARHFQRVRHEVERLTDGHHASQILLNDLERLQNTYAR